MGGWTNAHLVGLMGSPRLQRPSKPNASDSYLFIHAIIPSPPLVVVVPSEVSGRRFSLVFLPFFLFVVSSVSLRQPSRPADARRTRS